MARHRTNILWWGYAKRVAREYGYFQKNPDESYIRQFESEAVQRAIEKTKLLRNGEERLKLIDLVFFKQSHSLQGACLKCFVSDRTGRQWHTDFIRLVGIEMGLCRD